MAGEWKNVELGDVAAVRSGYAFKSSSWTDSGVPVVKIANVKGGRLEMSGCSYVEESTAAAAGEFQLTTGDILIAMTGYIGDVARVRKTDLPCVLNQRVGKFSVRDGKQLDADFLYTFLAWAETRQAIEGLGYGSAQPNVSPSLIHKVEMPLPPLAEQKAIAAVLGALDDKIELNRRMNATLEAMARALFQSWFVDFDPVRAKMDGRKAAGIDDATAALFPESFEDSALGHIPRGWEVRTIESVCETVTRGVTPEYGEGTSRFIINQRVNRGSELDWSSLKELSEGLEVPPERFAKRWDVLVNCLGEGTLGRTHLYKGASDVFAIDQHMSICRAEHRSGGAYIYQVLSGADGQAKIESLKTGSTGMTMFNISKLRSFELVWPSQNILAAYFATVEPLWLQIANNDQESRILAQLRDTLLPKLLSGEIRVPEAESLAT